MQLLFASFAGTAFLATMFLTSSDFIAGQFVALERYIDIGNSYVSQAPATAVVLQATQGLVTPTSQLQSIPQPTPQTPTQPAFPPQVTTLEGSRIYVPETTYTTINSDAIEKKLLIQKDYFSKQIDRIYDRLQSTNGDLNDRIDVVGTGGSSGISFATIALGGTGISTVPSYGQLLMGDGSGGYTLIATSSLGISSGVSSQWTTAGSDIYYIGGNVGIGTTTLNGRLTIEQTHDAQTVARIANYSDSANAYTELSVRAGNVTTYLGSTPQNSSAVTGAGSSGRGYVWSQATGANRGLDLIAASTNSDLRFYTAGTAAANERMRITSTGDVGIGTTSPAYKLHVYAGTGSATQNIQTADAGGEAAINLENTVRRWKLKATAAASDAFVIRDQTAAQDRLVISNTGNVGIGTTSPYAKLSVVSASTATTTLALRPVLGQTANTLDVYNTTGSVVSVINNIGNFGIGTAAPLYPLHVSSTTLTDVARFSGSGGTQCTVVTGTGFSCTSDERFKTHIETLNDSTLENVLKLRPVNFNWKYDPDGKKQIGFIAQELEDIFPELVQNDSSGYKSVAYAQLAPILVKAIQEQNVQIAQLNLVLNSSESLPQVFISRIVSALEQVSQIVVRTITADSVRTKELCVEDICVTREQFLKMIQNSGAQAESPKNENSSASDDEDSNTDSEEETQSDIESEAEVEVEQEQMQEPNDQEDSDTAGSASEIDETPQDVVESELSEDVNTEESSAEESSIEGETTEPQSEAVESGQGSESAGGEPSSSETSNSEGSTSESSSDSSSATENE